MPNPAYALPTQSELDSYLNNLVVELKTLLAGDLGKYETVTTTGTTVQQFDSILVEPPALKTNLFRMQPLSGIECIVGRTPVIIHGQMLGNGNECFFDYCITITQYNTNVSIQNAALKIISNPKFLVLSIRHTPFQEKEGTYIYEKYNFKIRVAKYINID